jgi:hypothetical protein
MTPHPTLAARFHKLFDQNHTNLLLFKQECNIIRGIPTHDPQLGNSVKNMKTQLPSHIFYLIIEGYAVIRIQVDFFKERYSNK